MAARALVATVSLGAVLLLAGASPASDGPREGRLLLVSGSGVNWVDAAGGRPIRLVPGAAPDWSPDGTQLAFARGGDIWLANADGSGTRRLTRATDRYDTGPAWAPDGSRIAFSSARTLADGTAEVEVWTVGRDGAGVRRLVPSAGDDREPAWSPDGRRVAFVSTRDGDDEIYVAPADGRDAVRVTESPGIDESPAWSPDGTRLAFASERDGNWEVYVAAADGSNPANVTAHPADDVAPAWSPASTRLAFATTRDGSAWSLYLANADGSGPVRLTAGRQPDWQLVPTARELLPDLDQREPASVSLSSSGGRTLLAFASAVDNVGRGPIWIRATRPSGRSTMRADQLVRLATGSVRAVANVGLVRYTRSPSHSHWHLLDFERYELRRASDFSLAATDRKTGFCLADHYGHARRVRHVRPRFLGNCGEGQPRLRTVEQGSSVGYTDRYPPSFHGQHIDVTHVPPGRYVLVHRANPENLLRERSYANNAASLLVRLGPSGVDVLAVCPGTERCR